MSAYGVTKVIDNIIQDNPVQAFPDAGETMAYNPDGNGMTPYGLSVPTISKSKAAFPAKRPVYYGANKCSSLRCGKGWHPCWNGMLNRCSCCAGWGNIFKL